MVDDIGVSGPPGSTSGVGWGLPTAVDGVICCGGDLGALWCVVRVGGGAGLAHGEHGERADRV